MPRNYKTKADREEYALAIYDEARQDDAASSLTAFKEVILETFGGLEGIARWLNEIKQKARESGDLKLEYNMATLICKNILKIGDDDTKRLAIKSITRNKTDEELQQIVAEAVKKQQLEVNTIDVDLRVADGE